MSSFGLTLTFSRRYRRDALRTLDALWDPHIYRHLSTRLCLRICHLCLRESPVLCPGYHGLCEAPQHPVFHLVAGDHLLAARPHSQPWEAQHDGTRGRCVHPRWAHQSLLKEEVRRMRTPRSLFLVHYHCHYPKKCILINCLFSYTLILQKE